VERGQKLNSGQQMFVEFEAMRLGELQDIGRFILNTGQDKARMTLYSGQLKNFSAER
jgi:hypothetical protein